MDALFQAVTMIIPKAGVQLSGVPVTLSLVLFAIAILRNPNQTVLAIQQRKWIGILYAVLFVFGVFTFCLGVLDGFSAFKLAQIVTVVASPLAGVIALRMKPEQSFKILCVALIIVNIYAAVQFAVGIDAVSIEGLTYTYGQSLEQKPIGWGASEHASALKMPSTFQNGNYLGIFDALGVSLILMWKPKNIPWPALRYFSIACGVLGIILCGSRSIVIPFVLVAILLLIQRYRATKSRMKGTYLSAVSIALTAGVIYMLMYQRPVIEQFFTRNLTQTLDDPTAAGRTVQWAAIASGIRELNGFQLLRLFIVGQGNYGLGGEGLPTFFVTFGLFGTIAFFGMLIASIIYLWREQKSRTVALGVFCALFAFCVDSSFYYPPNVMLVFMMIGMTFGALRQVVQYTVI